jgi:D-alanine-D-alanine ligase
VLIVYNQPVLPRDHPDALSELDVLETVAEVEKVLPPEQFTVDKLGYARDPRLLLDKVERWKPDVVFNLYEGEADRTATEVYHAALLEWLGVSFTGTASSALAAGRDKVRTKYLLQGAGLPTAAFRVIDRLPAGEWPHAWPAIVKPAYQDASVGIDQASVVSNPQEMAARVEWLFERFGGPVLAEQFLDGREFHINLIEEAGLPEPLVVLPATELRFQAGAGYWPIYSYEGKWNESSVEYKSTALVTGEVLPAGWQPEIERVCRAGYRLIGMRDFGRVDVRVTADGTPHVLEVNPNPYLNSLALIEGLRATGRDFPQFIRAVVGNALGRREAAL